jgi:CheY-like chemotaxis protein
LKILLADDSMTAQNMGKKILSDAGYDVVSVSNGAAAVKKIAEINPSLCILDIYMPGYTGLEVCDKVKSSPATARMPVLLTVGKMEPYKPEEGARVRADGVIVKPFEASELLRAVQRFSTRASGIQTAAAAAAPAAASPPPPPASTPATYEKTVKLTREQLKEIMDPSSPKWHGGTVSPEVAPAAAARTDMAAEVAQAPALAVEDVVANTKMGSTADGMPGFAAAAVAEPAPAAIARIHEQPSNGDRALAIAVVEAPVRPAAELDAGPNASAVLPGFVDYLIANAAIVGVTAEIMEGAPVKTAEGALAASSAEFAVEAQATVEATEPAAVPVETAAMKPAAPPVSTKLEGGVAIGKIPVTDPALEVAPPVAITPTPDPQFEAPSEIAVANATEQGLQPTSRAAESAGVETATDPNLSPMIGLVDAVHPLEGGRYVVPEAPVEAASSNEPEEKNSAQPATGAGIGASAVASPAQSGKKSKKGKEMRPVPAVAPDIPAGTTPDSHAQKEVKPAAAKPEVSAEIAAVLDLLSQTAGMPIGSTENPTAGFESVEDAAATPLISSTASRVWMAEEVALTESENTISLENEMRMAYAPSRVDHRELAETQSISGAMVDQSAMVTAAPAEDPVRDDKTAPKSAMPDPEESSSGAGASPTQELAAAMAAAFGGALPKEDLARAEETQSISEEVRRFALGDAYKPKPTFGGAAIDDPDERTVTTAKLSAAISRVLDRLKPQLIAEILQELEEAKEE